MLDKLEQYFKQRLRTPPASNSEMPGGNYRWKFISKGSSTKASRRSHGRDLDVPTYIRRGISLN